MDHYHTDPIPTPGRMALPIIMMAVSPGCDCEDTLTSLGSMSVHSFAPIFINPVFIITQTT